MQYKVPCFLKKSLKMENWKVGRLESWKVGRSNGIRLMQGQPNVAALV